MKETDTGVVRITSNNPNQSSFGTGFVFYRNNKGVYIITCAHVLRDIGQALDIRVNGLPVEIVAQGESYGLDIAVLCVKNPNAFLQTASTFIIKSVGHTGKSVCVIGVHEYDKYYRFTKIEGKLGEPFSIEVLNQTSRIRGWDLKVNNGSRIERGYSGSPVIDKNSDVVLGILFAREGENIGGVMSITALKKLDLPADLRAATDPLFNNKESQKDTINNYINFLQNSTLLLRSSISNKTTTAVITAIVSFIFVSLCTLTTMGVAGPIALVVILIPSLILISYLISNVNKEREKMATQKEEIDLLQKELIILEDER